MKEFCEDDHLRCDQAYLIFKSEEAVILQDHHTHCTEVTGKPRAPRFQRGVDKRLVGGSCGVHYAPYGKGDLMGR